MKKAKNNTFNKKDNIKKKKKNTTKKKNIIDEDNGIVIREKSIKNILNKRNIIILSITIIVIVIFFLFLGKNNNSSTYKYLNNININKDTSFQFKNDINSRIAGKYNISNDKIFISKKDVYLNSIKGKMIYVRDNSIKANIFQTYVDIKEEIEGVPILIIMSQYMESFENNSLIDLNISSDIKIKESFYGDRKFKFKLTPEESILKENREYTKSFNYDGVKYDINYYIYGDNLVCELVRFF